ncbi:MAG: COG4315 family predicted lipoprotein [Jiangellaceae bacterium]
MTGERLQQVTRQLGAGALLVVGGVHLDQYLGGYSEIDTIGVLFMLNVISATVLAIGLLLPVERLVRRWGSAIAVLSALGGVVVAGSSLVMLMMAERRPLFGFMEPGFDPGAIALSRISEVTTVVLLGTFLLSRAASGRSGAPKHSDDAAGTRPHVGDDDRIPMRMAVTGVLAVAALALAACGGDGTDDSTAVPAAGTDGATVAVAEIDGQNVLVDANGDALYVSDEEADGEPLCISDGCVAFWEPLTTDGDAPTGEVPDGTLGEVTRPDGSVQVTLDKRPLYSFAEDEPGQVNGDGLSDSFDGQTLTWHVATADGSTGSGPATGGGYGY